MSEHVTRLRKAAEEIRREGHAGWGNTCEEAADEIERLRTALRPFVEAYERCGRRESWAASYLNNNAWKAAAEALPTKDSQCHGEPGVDCPVHPMTEENQKPVNHIE